MEDLEGLKTTDALPGEFPYLRGTKKDNNEWLVRQEIKVECPKEANAKALDILNKGVDSLSFHVKAKELNAEYVVCDTLEDVLKNADVISVATAGKVKVHITPEMLKPGALLTITGTADLPKEMYLKNRVAVDNWQMHLDYLEEGKMCYQGIEGIRDWASSYDMLMLYEQGLLKEDNIVSLGEVVAGTALPRKNEEDKLLLVVGGLPIEDVAWGYDLYNNALEKGLGQKLKIWDKPHWH